ncbi:N acetyltransferase ESCO1 [Fasciola gigantica]|uniref:N acetyltransferase ESCO1 n=1 Tax=Fasciola gigantica TaxID=46835 RepID=A0A504YKZ9_FASGI|nr:N acetyltransferase ESCO1 [Fasciola gigantica]
MLREKLWVNMGNEETTESKVPLMNYGKSNHGTIQMKLDFGQKNFKYARCEKCQMVYNLADVEDQSAHTVFHAKYVAPKVKLPRGKHQQILLENFDGSRIVELYINNRSGATHFSKISSVMARDLGHDNPETVSTRESSPADLAVPGHWRVFAYVLDGSQLVVGCCVVELLTATLITSQGYHIRRLSGGRKSLLSWCLLAQDQTYSQPSSVPSSSDAGTRVPLPLCGVRRLWVYAKYRRKGVATRLLTCVLSNVICGRPLPKSQVAFAEPTACGADFAVAFTGREDFITY